jgi:hypothetical protein
MFSLHTPRYYNERSPIFKIIDVWNIGNYKLPLNSRVYAEWIRFQVGIVCKLDVFRHRGSIRNRKDRRERH